MTILKDLKVVPDETLKKAYNVAKGIGTESLQSKLEEEMKRRGLKVA